MFESQKPGGQEADSKPRYLGQPGKEGDLGAAPTAFNRNLSFPPRHNWHEKKHIFSMLSIFSSQSGLL